MPRPLLLALLAVCLLPAAPAAAAERTVPSGWLGVVADGPLTAAGADVDAEWDLMAASGVESVRTAFYWPAVQPHGVRAARPLALSTRSCSPPPRRRDARAADRHRHARLGGDAAGRRDLSAARPAAATPTSCTTLVGRYGPQGSLWAEHPEVPPLPIRAMADLERAEPDPILGPSSRSRAPT